MIFDYPVLLAVAPLLALLAALVAWRSRRRRIRLARAWSAALATLASARGRGAPLVLGATVLLGGIALAGPRGGNSEVTTQSRALSMILAVDISRSMLAEDAGPGTGPSANRLQRAVRESRRLIQDLSGDRLGLVAFAGRSYILSPLTVDGGAVRMFLDALDPDLASQGGTSLAAVLTQSAQLLSGSGEVSDRVLVLFTDGETHDTLPDALAAAQQLKDAGIRLVVVAEGRAEPVRIPIRDASGTLLEYKRACAMAYLGRRAQLHGGVCSTRHPHIMTAQFTLDLEANNRVVRFTRYPWLRALMLLLGEIEQIQDQIATTNVITLVPAAK